MSHRTLKTGLSLGILVAAAGVAMSLGWAFMTPVIPNAAPPPAVVQPVALQPPASDSRSIPAGQFESFIDRRLRTPLYDPLKPKPAPRPVVRRLPPPPIQVLGTVIEHGHSMAILRYSREPAEVKKVGDLVGPESSRITVQEVKPDLVVVNQRGQVTTIPVK